MKSQQDKKAEDFGWLVLKSNEGYEKQLNVDSGIYILKEGKKWCVWRGYWMPDKPKAVREKTLIKNVSFETALTRANGYVNWLGENKRVREQQSKE